MQQLRDAIEARRLNEFVAQFYQQRGMSVPNVA
jgi:queuine/archaeosine tRNA-ribosyltransferase